MTVAAGALLGAAAYAHLRIPRYTAGSGRILLLRAILVGAGLIFGYAAARDASDAVQAALAFATGFGAVHVPAAVILFIKRARGAPKS